jgi:hypothetical protein
MMSTVDVIEFRRTGDRLNERAEVVINGVELARLWQQATRRGSSPLFVSEVGDSLELWGPDGGVSPSPSPGQVRRIGKDPSKRLGVRHPWRLPFFQITGWELNRELSSGRRR